MYLSYSFPSCVLGIPFFGEVITVGDVEEMTVNEDVLPDDEVFRLENYPLSALVVPSFQELTCPEA